ncbi:MAG: hypothetical protein QCI38_09115, partial [Candidatus Thermoplasmatota archaeon]|nr:hypothetical protein [Candidatus Thermoplasmatota archaeon]
MAMRSVGVPRSFVYERWVEGPLEGMEDLSRGLNKEKDGMKAIMGVSAFVLFSFLLILFISLAFDIWGLANAQNIAYQLTGLLVSLL